MKKLALKAGSPADANSCFVFFLRTANDALRPGDIVKVVNNFMVDKVANNTEQAWGVVSGKWDLNKDAVPVILTGLIYMPNSMVGEPGTGPTNGCIFNFGAQPGRIIKPDGTEEASVATVWINV